ncbi:1-deoxy-D-xylulose-5-phosphate synthase [Prosthecobacter fluviatilis]|uniref:1-deoxy-D-xylulose-5-phosphate synthase n=1 Tax=Prosthecobacter fluviatilis TaxID=445931 RepID=A0ABW0KSC5_9BACT
MKTRIMYIENKSGGLSGPARIGRVRLSKTGRTLFYGGLELKNLDGAGYKSNHVDLATGHHYWVSGPRKDGEDRLYGGRVPVEIDEDVREEYWTKIRNLPERINDGVQ